MKTVCKVCRSPEPHIFYSHGLLALLQNRFYQERREAMLLERMGVDLAFCPDCGLSFNAANQDNLVLYDTHYNNNQSTSLTFQAHLRQVAGLLKDKGLLQRKVVEVGCGKGDFLRLLRQQGVAITGFDPAFEEEDKDIIRDYFSVKYADKCVADFIILRHVLEHLSDPFELLSSIAEVNQYRGSVYIEVPSFEWIVKHKAFWDIFPEHCNYFMAAFWASLFSEYEHGLNFEGQYQYIIAEWKSLRKKPRAMGKVSAPDLSGLSGFIQWYCDFVKGHKDVLVWGAGAKGVTFANLIDPQRKYIAALVDINVHKQGRYIGGTGHPVIGPQDIGKNAGEIIIMNGVYEKEIRTALNGTHANLHVMGEGVLI